MRRIIVLIIFVSLFLSGCYNGKVSFVYVNMTEDYANYSNTSISQTIFFIVRNTAFSGADCKAEFSLKNDLGVNTSIYDIGSVKMMSEKKVMLNFDMPSGNTSFNLTPNCVFTNKVYK